MSSGILATSVSATSKILLLTGGGVLMERRGILTADGRALFNRVVCSAMLPALLFVTTMLPLGAPLLDLAPLILSCLGTIAVGNALGRLFGRLMPTEASRKACVLACTCSNAGAVPMMLMASLCADQSSALHGSTGCDAPEGYPGLFSIPMNVLYWTWAVAYMGKDDSAAAETTTTTSQGGGAATAEAPAVAGTNLSAAPPRRMKRSRSDVFEMVDGELVAKNCGGVDDSLAEPVVLASSTLPIITSNSPRPTTALGPYQSTQPTPPPPLDLSVATIPELPVSGGVTRAPSCNVRTSWGASLRQKLAQRLVQGTQYTLVPLEDAETPTTLATELVEPSCLWHYALRFGELASMPPNAAILLALVVGLSPLRNLLVLSSEAAARGESAPLAVLFDTLDALGAGANPSLMLLLGASLSDTARSARSAANSSSSTQQQQRSSAGAPDIRRSCCEDDSPPGLEGTKQASCAAFLARWMLIPIIHVLGLWLLTWSGLFSSLETDVAQRFVILSEGAVPASMTVLAIAVQQGNREVEKQLGIVLLSQYSLSAITLTASTSLFLKLV